MTIKQFVEECDLYLLSVASSQKSIDWNIQADWNAQATINVDDTGCIWLCKESSIKRVKTSFNVENVAEFRYWYYVDYANEEREYASFFIIANNYSSLYFDGIKKRIDFFQDEQIRNNEDKWLGHDAIKWFTEHPVE